MLTGLLSLPLPRSAEVIPRFNGMAKASKFSHCRPCHQLSKGNSVLLTKGTKSSAHSAKDGTEGDCRSRVVWHGSRE